MFKVIIFGTGKSANIVENMLNDKVEILAYSDNNQSKWRQKRNSKTIISPKQLNEYEYDYVIIGSQFNEEIYMQLVSIGVPSSKIFQFYKFADNYNNYYKNNIKYFLSVCENVELISTGISYSWFGFKCDVCEKKAFNFAFGSQDLFYDFFTVKHLFENYSEKMSCVKYALIGISYYSFQYDMSLSSMRGKVILYYDVLRNAHNFKEINRVYNEYDINRRVADKIFKKNADGNYEFKLEVPTLNEYEDNWLIGKKQANIDCNKNYPETVKENIQIVKDYIKFLEDHNVKPIIVVYPATKYYTENFSKRIEDEFHFIINQIEKKYNFQYIDCFRSDLFTDDDFRDVSHLNLRGAEKFTKILNEKIKW
ncbi:chemotaxis protein [Clostridium oryzae]|uniref:C2185-like N-terminal domain-containing protein n=1 Tax=Clostridium oryzae TaxID=1450648 RepID=A0A1V4I576_9CLOT|nr:chemotaxis protein [Clostridium oryzae]OPJ55122.1 hypothetical protein CLORY_44650 [Clostridium oryzae]